MKIAVACQDAQTVSRHFGRSRCFVVFDVADGEIVGRELRENTFTAHARGECDEGRHDTPHGHADIVAALRDCEVVLCAGMGRRAAEELKANGIEPLVVAGNMSAREAVRSFLDGDVGSAAPSCGWEPEPPGAIARIRPDDPLRAPHRGGCGDMS